MLYAVFKGHDTFIFLAMLTAATVGLFGFKIARTRTARAGMHGLLTAAVTSVICLTLWTTGSPVSKPMMCVINRDLLEPFTTTQGLLNAGMFAPVGLLGVLATKKVSETLIGGVLLTLSIETLQGAFSFLGRGCDTSDLLMNSIGVIIGALLGWVIDYATKRPAASWGSIRRSISLLALGMCVAMTATWVGLFSLQTVSRTIGIGQASDAQSRAARKAVQDAFGNHFKINQVQFAAGPHGSGTVMAEFDEGFAELSWPDRQQFNASLDVSDSGTPSGFPIAGTEGNPRGKEEAQRLAVSYARDHAPWGLVKSDVKTQPVGPSASLGWMNSWRRRGADGVLMPMRLDIQVDRNGRISQLIMRNVHDPKLPEVRIDRGAAITAVLKRAGSTVQKGQYSSEIIARQEKSGWRPVWLLGMPTEDGEIRANIDANSGKFISYGRIPAGITAHNQGHG
ncbi:VanZ family protein [Streptomyces sp. NPDC056192]|uniref:VanZ family protein n=1 Tax=Streptomyces sp. NPDC056192 TaxID=3345743 RepID=UPI0035E35A32